MAFVGEYPRHMFFKDSNEGGEEGDQWYDSGTSWVARFITYCLFGIVIMVTLNNIFIGIVGNTYDHFQERASLLFVRQRALTALEYVVMWPMVDEISHLWCCTVPESDETSGGVSLRSSINEIVGKRLDAVMEEVQHVVQRVDGVEVFVRKSFEDLKAEIGKLQGKRDKKAA